MRLVRGPHSVQNVFHSQEGLATGCKILNISARDYRVFGLCPSSGILKNTTLRKPGLFPPQVMVWETVP
jgi:hypothetical protein